MDHMFPVMKTYRQQTAKIQTVKWGRVYGEKKKKYSRGRKAGSVWERKRLLPYME